MSTGHVSLSAIELSYGLTDVLAHNNSLASELQTCYRYVSP